MRQYLGLYACGGSYKYCQNKGFYPRLLGEATHVKDRHTQFAVYHYKKELGFVHSANRSEVRNCFYMVIFMQ